MCPAQGRRSNPASSRTAPPAASYRDKLDSAPRGGSTALSKSGGAPWPFAREIPGVAGLRDDVEPALGESRAIPSRIMRSSSPITTRRGSDIGPRTTRGGCWLFASEHLCHALRISACAQRAGASTPTPSGVMTSALIEGWRLLGPRLQEPGAPSSRLRLGTASGAAARLSVATEAEDPRSPR
jgi:hypothetical protein